MTRTLKTLYTTLTILGGVTIATPLLAQEAKQSIPRAMADNPDTVYCSTLTKKYNQYLNETVGQGGPATSLDGHVAIEQCSGSNTKASIFILEQKLNNAKIDLPKR